MKKDQMKGPAEQVEDQVKKPTDKKIPKKGLEDKGKHQKGVDKAQLGFRELEENVREMLRTSTEFFGGGR